MMYSGECVGGPKDGEQFAWHQDWFAVAVMQHPMAAAWSAEMDPRYVGCAEGEYLMMERHRSGENVMGYWWYEGPGRRNFDGRWY